MVRPSDGRWWSGDAIDPRPYFTSAGRAKGKRTTRSVFEPSFSEAWALACGDVIGYAVSGSPRCYAIGHSISHSPTASGRNEQTAAVCSLVAGAAAHAVPFFGRGSARAFLNRLGHKVLHVDLVRHAVQLQAAVKLFGDAGRQLATGSSRSSSQVHPRSGYRKALGSPAAASTTRGVACTRMRHRTAPGTGSGVGSRRPEHAERVAQGVGTPSCTSRVR